MVNEINKPPSSENIMLGERLAASNRQLQEMQEEHRQLIQEMEMLRQRAAELSRLNEQHFDDPITGAIPQPSTSAIPQENTATPEAANVRTENFTAATAAPITRSTEDAPTCSADIAAAQNKTAVNSTDAAPDTEEEDPEAAEYLRAKLAELSNLKAQFKRVKNMMDTTELIERHMDTKNNNDAASSSARNLATGSAATTSPAETAQSSSAAASIHPENEELMSAMMNMFTEFTSDLRNQAEDLRAERDRIRALKEELLRRKQQS